MNCKQAQRRLPGYLDGAIRAQDHAGLREHLHSCADCRQHLERYRLLASRLANVEPVAVPAEIQPAPAVPAPMILPYSSPGQARPDNQLATVSGAIYKSVEVESVKDDGIIISYTAANGSWGMTKVYFEDLPAEIRQQYGK